MRILGIDPGLRFTGWGIIDYISSTPRHIANGTIKTVSTLPMADRLAHIMMSLQTVIKDYAPNVSAIEETFVNANPASALKLGQARGVAMTVPALSGLSVYEYAPNQIKKTIVGAGHAHKDQVQLMLKMLMPGVNFCSADSADALAIALCHAHHMPPIIPPKTYKDSMVEA